MRTLFIVLLTLAVVANASRVIRRKVSPKRPYIENEITDVEEHIIAGTAATLGQFPWQAALLIYDAGGAWICGGSLIHRQWVISAGHCTIGSLRVYVRLGTLTRREGGTLYNITATSTTVITHPNYNNYYLYNDLGLIKLPTAVTVSANIAPINIIPSLTAFSQLAISGWGVTCDQPAPAVCDASLTLNWANVTAISDSLCSQSYGAISKTTLCTMALNGGSQSTCFGDSGGPLAKLGSPPYLVGVTSFVHYDGCEAKRPMGFVRVYKYCTWLKSKIGTVTNC